MLPTLIEAFLLYILNYCTLSSYSPDSVLVLSFLAKLSIVMSYCSVFGISAPPSNFELRNQVGKLLGCVSAV